MIGSIFRVLIKALGALLVLGGLSLWLVVEFGLETRYLKCIGNYTSNGSTTTQELLAKVAAYAWFVFWSEKAGDIIINAKGIGLAKWYHLGAGSGSHKDLSFTLSILDPTTDKGVGQYAVNTGEMVLYAFPGGKFDGSCERYEPALAGMF